MRDTKPVQTRVRKHVRCTSSERDCVEDGEEEDRGRRRDNGRRLVLARAQGMQPGQRAANQWTNSQHQTTKMSKRTRHSLKYIHLDTRLARFATHTRETSKVQVDAVTKELWQRPGYLCAGKRGKGRKHRCKDCTQRIVSGEDRLNRERGRGQDGQASLQPPLACLMRGTTLLKVDTECKQYAHRISELDSDGGTKAGHSKGGAKAIPRTKRSAHVHTPIGHTCRQPAEKDSTESHFQQKGRFPQGIESGPRDSEAARSGSVQRIARGSKGATFRQ